MSEPPTEPTPKTYWCACDHCRVPTKVSERTWHRHRPFRRDQPAFDLQFDVDMPPLVYPDSEDEDDEEEDDEEEGGYEEDGGMFDPAPAPAFGDILDQHAPEDEERLGADVCAPAAQAEEDPYHMDWDYGEPDEDIVLDYPDDDEPDPDCLAALEDMEEVGEPRAPTPPPPPVDEVVDDGEDNVRLEDLRMSQAFIDHLNNATLDNDGLHPDTLHQLRHPPQHPINVQPNSDLRLALDLFLQHSETAYTKTRESICAIQEDER